ncbi:spore germination protein [Fictibacillus sp. 18YEL24]|uniref:spore germination protein n=1 Tax=Fictibacillus sp. 18YEL24 TaxID=2745875 RepID=UPI00351CE617|nr:spore germination protein [Fictibacillus sp. 18YEL24]
MIFKVERTDKAENEVVIKGPKEAFTENISTNISLIRKRIKNQNLIVESNNTSKDQIMKCIFSIFTILLIKRCCSR